MQKSFGINCCGFGLLAFRNLKKAAARVLGCNSAILRCLFFVADDLGMPRSQCFLGGTPTAESMAAERRREHALQLVLELRKLFAYCPKLGNPPFFAMLTGGTRDYSKQA